MATWVTHLMIADTVLEAYPQLNRQGFCVGNIAPDCNIENEDWTAFTPPREVTHWMLGSRKTAADGDRFCEEYILPRKAALHCDEEYAFYLGYYCHLLTDAAYQVMIRDDNRVRGIWKRLKALPHLQAKAVGLAETFDNFKRLVPKAERLQEIAAVEADYLRRCPDSGYLTEILPLESFPDYMEFLPPGAIARKIRIMGTLPTPGADLHKLLSIDYNEYIRFVRETAALVIAKFQGASLL